MKSGERKKPFVRAVSPGTPVRPAGGRLQWHPLAAALLFAVSGGAAFGFPTDPTIGLVLSAAANSSESAAGIWRDSPFLRQHAAEFMAKRARAAAAATARASTPVPSVRTVNSCGDAPDDAGTLRNVIADAVSGDTIDLRGLLCSTITLMPGQIAIHATDLTIIGPGVESLTIDGQHAMRPFYHYGTGRLMLRDVTIANGRHVDMDSSAAHDGGCILSLGTVALDHAKVTSCEVGSRHALGGAIFAYNLEMNSSTVSDSSALSDNGEANGGGIFVLGSGVGYGVTMQASAISGNQAKGLRPAGGGVMTMYAGIQMAASVVSGNTAYNPRSGSVYGAVGGGLLAWTHKRYYGFDGVALSMRNSTIDNNSARSASVYALGGGVYVKGEGPISIDASSISSNKVAGRTISAYGGLAVLTPGATDGDYSTLHTVRDSTISGNVVSGELAGPYDRAYAAGMRTTSATLYLYQSTVSGNRVETGRQRSFAGGIAAQQLVLSHSTVAFNSALGSAGGLFVARTGNYPQTRVESSIVASNVAPVDADIGVDDHYQIRPVLVLGSHNLIGTAVSNPLIMFPQDTIVADPRLLPLAWNGGLTRTHALGPGSPAIDAGSPSSEDYDQRGFPFLRAAAAGTDIGAYERQTPRIGVSAAFAPDRIESGGASRLTLTLLNTYTVPATLIAPLVDTLPAGLTIATPANVSMDCPDGTYQANEGASSLTIASQAQIPIGLCTFGVDVAPAAAGTYVNTLAAGALSTNFGINTETSVATMIVSQRDRLFADGFDSL